MVKRKQLAKQHLVPHKCQYPPNISCYCAGIHQILNIKHILQVFPFKILLLSQSESLSQTNLLQNNFPHSPKNRYCILLIKPPFTVTAKRGKKRAGFAKNICTNDFLFRLQLQARLIRKLISGDCEAKESDFSFAPPFEDKLRLKTFSTYSKFANACIILLNK